MGIDAQGLDTLLYARSFQPFGDTVTLGRQFIHAPSRYVARRLGISKEEAVAATTEDLLKLHFGASDVQSLDYSDYEGASLLHDLNTPLPGDFRQFDAVIDFGTLEHVFNIPVALENVRHLCRPGGQILHVLPANNFCGHGFWQISPELFFSTYHRGNGFADTEVFLARPKQTNVWYRVLPPRDGKRVTIKTLDELYVICRTRLTEATGRPLSAQQSDYLHLWANNFANSDSLNSRLRKAFEGWYWRASMLNPKLRKVRVSDLLARRR